MKYPKPSKKVKKKRKRLITMPRLLKKADAIFSIWIRTRDGYRCVLCNSTVRVQNGHLIARGKRAVRFDVKNCNAQCSRCNYKHEFEPQHYISWFLRKWGEGEYLDLVDKSKPIYKFSRSELEDLCEKYRIG